MRTARRKSWPREGKSEGKSEENIEEVISRPCASDEGCISLHVGRRSAGEGRQDEARAARAGNTAFVVLRITSHETRITVCTAFGTEALQSCFSRLGLPSMMTGRRESQPAFLMKWRGEVRAGHETRITAFTAVRFALVAKGSYNQKPPPEPPRLPPSHCLPVHHCSPLFTIVRHCSAENIAPEPKSAYRPPFSVGLTTSVVSRSSRRPAGSLGCG